MPRKEWKVDEVNKLRDNWKYYLTNKTQAIDEFGCTWDSITHKAYRNNIHLKPSFRENKKILNEARNYIDGLLLSDGCISSNRNKTGIYQQSCVYNEWLDIIKEKFSSFGIQGNINNGLLRTGGFKEVYNPSFIYAFATLSYTDFKYMHSRWYILNEEKYYSKGMLNKYWNKIVPNDLNLTSECVANWYIGDGCISTNPQIVLATYGFKKEDVIFLSELLLDTLDVYNTINKHNGIVISRKNCIKTFINYIKDYKVDCYAYKFPDKYVYET